MPLWYMQVRSVILILHSVIGIALIGYSFHRKKGFAWRLPLAVAAAALAAYLVQTHFYVPGIELGAIITQSAVSLFNYGLVSLICWFCLDESFVTRLFVTTSGMTAQGMAGCIKSIVKLIPPVNDLAANDLGILLVDLVCYGGVFAAVYFIFRPFTRDREELIGNRSKAIFSTAVFLFYMATTWLSRDYSNGQSPVSMAVTNIYSILIMVMVYAVQFNVLERDRMSRSMETMRELMHQQRLQYEASRESVQLINEKYHDLKNLIGSVKSVLPKGELDRLKSSIARYDVRVRTGFEVLDVVLTEKMDLCLQRGISMTCNLGRTDFGFMEEMDLYTLFNNALTNAINAVSSLSEGEARYIVLTAAQEGNILTIHMENPCGEDIRFVDGLPQTSGDPDWHGFGMKSMARTAEKYGGALSVSQDGGRFQLDVLLLDLREN